VGSTPSRRGDGGAGSGMRVPQYGPRRFATPGLQPNRNRGALGFRRE
jgi:hypothetical protein